MATLRHRGAEAMATRPRTRCPKHYPGPRRVVPGRVPGKPVRENTTRVPGPGYPGFGYLDPGFGYPVANSLILARMALKRVYFAL